MQTHKNQGFSGKGLKGFADNKLNVAKKMINICESYENFVGQE